MTATSTILTGDCREVLAGLPEQSVHMCVTSPPYWLLRDYGVDGQLGSEQTLDEYIAGQVEVFRAVWRVLRDDGTLWLNMGDGYATSSPSGTQGQAGERADRTFTSERMPARTPVPAKNLIGQPWRLAFALQAAGWYLRSDIIWAKPNPMPESVTDRPTKSHEYLFLLTKKPTYFYDADAVRERATPSSVARSHYDRSADKTNKGLPTGRGREDGGLDYACGFNALPYTLHPAGRNLRTVWQIATQSFSKAHFATFPEKLVVPCIKAGTSEKGCCPECGAPWRRVVEMTDEYKAVLDSGQAWRTSDGKPEGLVNRQEKGHVSNVPQKNRTIGWQPGCGCSVRDGEPEDQEDIDYHKPIPCTVLDCYAGSGTTGVVAKQLDRSFVGIELNPDYCEMARKRIANPYPKPEVPDVVGQEVLFN